MAFRMGVASLLFVALVALNGAPGLACNKDFKVYNKTDKAIVKLYVSPYLSDQWEDNVLANEIEPNTSRTVDMTDDKRSVGFYDVKAVYEDGTKTEGHKINLCRAATIKIYDGRVI